MKWLARESFSDRRFPGWRAFLIQIFVVSWVAGGLFELIRAGSALITFDTMGVVLVWPMMVAVCIFLLAFVCLRLWRVSFVAALGGLLMYVPVLFLVPAFEFLIRGLGFVYELGFASGWQALTLLLTGGILPVFVIPLAFQLTWMFILAWVVWSWWRSTSVPTLWELAQGLAFGYIGFPLLFLLPSFIGWFILFGEVPIWSTTGTIVGQAFAVAQIDGYPWRAIYERFPLAIGGEAHVSQTWLFAISAWFVGVGVIGFERVRAWQWSWRRLGQFATRERSLRILGLVLLGGVGAFVFKEGHAFTWMHLVAWCGLLVTGGLFALAQAAEVDLLEAAHGSLSADRPLAMGAIRSADLVEASWIWLVAGCFGAGLLGMSVFLSFMLAYLAHRQALGAKDRWTFLGWASLPVTGYFLAGWMMVAERGSFGVLAPAFATLAFLLFFAWNWRKN